MGWIVVVKRGKPFVMVSKMCKVSQEKRHMNWRIDIKREGVQGGDMAKQKCESVEQYGNELGIVRESKREKERRKERKKKRKRG
jgi:hypothetical protein